MADLSSAGKKEMTGKHGEESRKPRRRLDGAVRR